MKGVFIDSGAFLTPMAVGSLSVNLSTATTLKSFSGSPAGTYAGTSYLLTLTSITSANIFPLQGATVTLLQGDLALSLGGGRTFPLFLPRVLSQPKVVAVS